MTYRQILKQLQNLVDSRLDDTATIYNENKDEFYPILAGKVQQEDDVLDDGHYYLTYRE